jgi:hypothetical protein
MQKVATVTRVIASPPLRTPPALDDVDLVTFRSLAPISSSTTTKTAKVAMRAPRRNAQILLPRCGVIFARLNFGTLQGQAT